MHKLVLTIWLCCCGSLLAEPLQDQLEAQMVTLTNQERVNAGLPALLSDATLVKVSRGHSEEMARLNYFEHESPTPGFEQPWDRAHRAGVGSHAFAENIFLAEGYDAQVMAKVVVSGWMNSPGHRANILGPNFTRIGIGLARLNKQVYVTQMFSARLNPYP